MRFTKAHGTGNDFVVLADLGDSIELSSDLVRALTDRDHGIGADGVLRIGPGRRGSDVFMDYRNADGGIVEMCGNGVRVVAKHVLDHGLLPIDSDTIVVGTRAGDKPVTVHRDARGLVDAATVDMGPAVTQPDQVPFVIDDGDQPLHTMLVDDAVVELSVVSMGNPHAVIVVDDVATADVAGIGARLQSDTRFPRGVNVGFARPLADDRIALRVNERGVGETAACGTGACAAAVALHRLGLAGSRVVVELPGGNLEVHHQPGGTVTMTGDAVEVAHGEIDPVWLEAATSTAEASEVVGT